MSILIRNARVITASDDYQADIYIEGERIQAIGKNLNVRASQAIDATGKIVSDSFEGEFRRSVENLRKVLQSAGADLAHVVQTRNYVRDAEDLPLFNRLYTEYFSAPYPARTTITGCLSPALRFELECIAVTESAG